MAMLRQLFGLDLPVLEQLNAYLSSLAHGSLGFSPRYNLPVATLIFYSAPGFWIGLMLIVLFSVKLGWLPNGGAETLGAEHTSLAAALLDRFRHMVLPATSLALFHVAIYARLTRASVLAVSSQDFVRTASAKGLSGFHIATRHILRNALLPVTTMAAACACTRARSSTSPAMPGRLCARSVRSFSRAWQDALNMLLAPLRRDLSC